MKVKLKTGQPPGCAVHHCSSRHAFGAWAAERAALRPRKHGMKDHPRRRPALLPRLLLAAPVVVFMLLYARTERTRRPETTKAGLIYLRIADPRHRQDAFRASWPPWLPALEASARANARSVTYYFVGAPANVTCANCKQIPLDLAGLRARVEKYLGVTDMEIKSVKNKICDLKPMWPALFPEVSARHEWVGFADADVLFGDLAAEVDLLTARDDLLVPSSWHPYPLANGNFMLFRSTERVLHAFRGAGWREAVRSPGYSVFDEWLGPAWKSNCGRLTMVSVAASARWRGGSRRSSQ